MSQAFVLWSMTPNTTELEHGSDDIIAGDLTSTTNLQFRTNDPSGHVVVVAGRRVHQSGRHQRAARHGHDR